MSEADKAKKKFRWRWGVNRWLILATFIIGKVVIRDRKISRAEGVVMLVLVTAYVAFVVIRGG